MSATGKRIRPLPNCRCLQLSGLVRPGSEATPTLRVGKDVAISVRSIALLSGVKASVRFAYNVSLVAKTNRAYRIYFRESTLRVDQFSIKR